LKDFANRKSLSQLLLIVCAFIVASLMGKANPQSISTDPGHKEYVSVDRVRFSCPNHFNVQGHSRSDHLAFMRHEKDNVGVFVAVPGKDVDDDYVKQLATAISASLLPQEKEPYIWKRLNYYEKVSKFEIGGGTIQGFNGQQRVFIQYRILKTNGKLIIVGYTADFGRGNEARLAFERNLAGACIGCWYAEEHIIASITGEKYDEVYKSGGIPGPREN
jgi:hypothetical protein